MKLPKFEVHPVKALKDIPGRNFQSRESFCPQIVVAVKKLVVGFRDGPAGLAELFFLAKTVCALTECAQDLRRLL